MTDSLPRETGADACRCPETMPALRQCLAGLATDAPPQLAKLAHWLIDRPEEIAFNSVRMLAALADCNANTVVRLARTLGHTGYDPLRAAVQEMLRTPPSGYAARAAALATRGAADVFAEMKSAAHANIDLLFTPELSAGLSECIDALLNARQVHCIGVRSCFAVAHYFTYVGAMAFPNIRPAPGQPGQILDTLSACTPDDVVIAVSYEDYSLEVVRGCQIARESGARVLALTDSYASPIAEGAWQVIRLPMAGPHLLPSLVTAFHLVELLLAELSARDPKTEARVRDFEARLLHYGGYVRRGQADR
ncbi:MurR/RpiR family transcriptional regulator [Polymorphum gilvum]|uniref:Transcriptional regulator, RpiR family n=1 Tax=Polymorphum gilvum (strain LMG 25793 / CGMCC 1.9160 / SL003B-26A1) TaxID=991905 RepID=F2IYT4_POLGS|nr:MurR/RpiR family transcriptional regulator [Polymorphum gilvum]ADZ69531.1 Transcriptional regulator, RpiR family [Polymorphum gilvum SL003B-26A1]